MFQQTEGEEVTLCGNQLVSKVIEKLLPKADADVRNRFMERLAEDLRITSLDAFASHILEKLMELASLSQNNDDMAQVGMSSKRNSWIS